MVATLILVSAASLVLYGCTSEQPPPVMPKEKVDIPKVPKAPKLPPPPAKDSTPK